MKVYIYLSLYAFCSISWGTDIYTQTKNQLQIPKVFVGNILYRDVLITVDKVIRVDNGSSNNLYDVYNPSDNQLHIPNVIVGNITYSNVVVTVKSVISVGGISSEIPVSFNNNISTIEINNAAGVTHSTGVIPFDVNSDSVTDLIFLPSAFNISPDLAAFSIINNGYGSSYGSNDNWNESFTTGFTKDWIITDLNNDNHVDLVWIDHGLELPEYQGGHENGYNAALISTNNNLNYSRLPGIKDFYHGLSSYTDESNINTNLIVSDFSNKPSFYISDGKGAFNFISLSLNDDFAYAKPGSVSTLKMQNGSTAIAFASYQRPNPQWDPKGILNIYQLINKNLILLSSAIPLPDYWQSNNLGAFAIIHGDFSNAGFDDLIVLGETSLSNYIRDVRYYQQSIEGFIDVTESRFGSISSLINQPDKIIPFDINQDGYLDLIGFSYKNGSYTNGFGAFINDGTGKFSSQGIGPNTLKNGANFPIFTTNHDGSWKNFIGVQSINAQNSTTINIQTWLLNSITY